VDYNRCNAIAVYLGNFANVLCVIGVSETLVMHDDIKSFGPVGAIVKINLGSRTFTPFKNNGPFNLDTLLLGGQLHRLGLVVVVVTASTCDYEHFDRFRCLDVPDATS
jgi:hypothetical protein